MTDNTPVFWFIEKVSFGHASWNSIPKTLFCLTVWDSKVYSTVSWVKLDDRWVRNSVDSTPLDCTWWPLRQAAIQTSNKLLTAVFSRGRRVQCRRPVIARSWRLIKVSLNSSKNDRTSPSLWFAAPIKISRTSHGRGYQLQSARTANILAHGTTPFSRDLISSHKLKLYKIKLRWPPFVVYA